MLNMLIQKARCLYRDEEGASIVEYVLLIALIAIVCIATIQIVGTRASAKITEVGGAIDNVPPTQ
ncbi:MAG: Flp family type IVb pilin [Armatimonadetes bacterium]|nr:Flp family type IVb pilin [Armatimonadota bacterium]